MTSVVAWKFAMNPSENRGYLTTEQSNPRSADLDVLSTVDLVKLFIDEIATAVSC